MSCPTARIAVVAVLLFTSGAASLPGPATASVAPRSAVAVAVAVESAGGDEAPACGPYGRPHSKVSRPGPFAFGEQKVEELVSEFDASKLQVGYVRPAVPAGHRVPVIVLASPYFAANLNDVDLVACEPSLTMNFVPHGYAVAYVPVRGTGDNGTCMDLMGAAEGADLDQAITWLGTQQWSNGRVAMAGQSYDGSTAWQVAARANPYLKTIVPIAGISDLYHLMYRNGAPDWRGLGGIQAYYWVFGWALQNPANGRSAERTVTGALCPDVVEGISAGMQSGATGERDRSGYWAERNARPGVEANYRGSILAVTGLQDWNVDPAHAYPWINELEDDGIYVKHLIGQWSHTWPDQSALLEPATLRTDWADIQLNWYDYWLKGDKTADIGPRVEVQDSAGQWRSAGSWPPARARPTTFYLASGSALTDQPADQRSSVLVGPDPARNNPFRDFTGVGSAQNPLGDACPTCAVFQTRAFPTDFRFAGIPEVAANVVPSGPGGHVNAYLYASGDSGDELLGWGQGDVRFPDGGEHSEPAVPGRPLKVRFQLEPLDAVVPAQSTLKLVLSQGSYGDHLAPATSSPLTVNVGGQESSLTVPVHTVSRGQLFSPAPVPRPRSVTDGRTKPAAQASRASAGGGPPPGPLLPATGGGSPASDMLLVAVAVAAALRARRIRRSV